METLRLEVQWPDGRYHGVEWPPSPWRVYQALVAGLGLERRACPGARGGASPSRDVVRSGRHGAPGGVAAGGTGVGAGQ